MEYSKEFEVFWKYYPGTKLGEQNEFKMFTGRHKDWRQAIPLLLPALQTQEKQRKRNRNKGEFVPPWKNLKTWLGTQRCWEQVGGREETGQDRQEEDARYRKKKKEMVREIYEGYLKDKKTPALLDILKDDGGVAKVAGWLITEILVARKAIGIK